MGDRIEVQLPVREIYLSVTDHPRQPGHPSVGRRNEYRQRVVMLSDWGVKAGMAFVW